MDPFSPQAQSNPPPLFPKKWWGRKNNKIQGFSLQKSQGDYFPSKQIDTKGLLSSPIEKKRIYILSLLIMISFTILGGRVIWLQGVHGQKYRNIAEGNRIRIVRIQPNRGLIYDRNLKPLVKNTAYFSLSVTPGDLPRDEGKREEIFNKLIQILEQTSSDDEENAIDIKNVVKNASPYSYQPIIIKKDLSYTHAMSLLVQLEDLPGISLLTSARRNYIQPEADLPFSPEANPPLAGTENAGMFSHILGYVGKISPEERERYPDYALNDFIGKTGIELQYEKILRGKFGQKRIEVNSLGKEERVESRKHPQSGYDLILSIDGELQEKIANTLTKYIKRAGSHAGAAVSLDPKTGEVLAIASFPSYNNNIFISGTQNEYQALVDDPYKPFVFRAISGEYPSGSVIKPVIAAGALNEGIIDENTTVNSYGGITVGKWIFKDWKEGGHGLTNVIKALAESVNTFFYYIGGGFKNFKGLGIDNINSYARMFGLAEKTGIDVPGERLGFVATPEWKKEVKKEQWYIGDTYHISIGQGDILVTPIQVAHYTAAIANGGTLFRPHLVKYIQNPENGEIQQVIDPEIINSEIIKQEYINIVKHGMRAAVTQGSAIRLSYLPIKVAGKTGTAEVGGDKKPHAWFTGFAPYEDPDIVITILVENGGEGSAVAVPAAYEILDWWAQQK
ncbi:penicillin-binding protein 2 [Patescibacteria group bacterium AH-259-L07]|nr:penicillin-binding protein 2 [Patescibacteria group bacterium AH-259-L07]